MINNLKKAVKKPLTLLVVLACAAYAVFLAVMLAELAVQMKFDSAKGMVIILTVWSLYLFLLNFMSYASRKGILFRPAHAHFIFNAPVDPKVVLIHGAWMNYLSSVVFFLIFIIAGITVFDVSPWRILLFAGICICNLALEIEHLLPAGYLEQTMETCIHEVMDVFCRPELGGIIVENVDVDCNLVDCFDGRQVTPGHAIEAMWFIMDLGQRLNRPELVQQAMLTTLTMLDYGWDKQCGGIYYFMDRNGCPPQQLEWDQKLWWVHIETLISLLKGYRLTGDKRCLEWFEKVHDYTWTHFKDSEYPEWFGYLNRQGEVLLPLKGGKWKGCFHVPRGLYQCWKTLESL